MRVPIVSCMKVFMKYLLVLILLCVAALQISNAYSLDYDELIHLDAESLAENGMKEAYLSILPELKKYVKSPQELVEINNDDIGLYAVRAGETTIEIYGPEYKAGVYEGWTRATYALFKIVNDQLGDSEYRFYAINGGNDLSGMFLEKAQADDAKKDIKKPTDWPYIPSEKAPWYGMYH